MPPRPWRPLFNNNWLGDLSQLTWLSAWLSVLTLVMSSLHLSLHSATLRYQTSFFHRLSIPTIQRMLIGCRNSLLVKVCGLWVHCTQYLGGASGWETDLIDPDVMVGFNRTGLRESKLSAKAAPSAEGYSSPSSPQLSTEKPGVYKFTPIAHKRLKESQRPHREKL